MIIAILAKSKRREELVATSIVEFEIFMQQVLNRYVPCKTDGLQGRCADAYSEPFKMEGFAKIFAVNYFRKMFHVRLLQDSEYVYECALSISEAPRKATLNNTS